MERPAIIRTWHGRTRLQDGDAYEVFMKEKAAPDYASVDGLSSLYFTRRDEGEVANFLLITFWDSIEAVEAFAGSDPEKAKYYDEDKEFLLEMDETSRNHRLFHTQ